MAMLSLSSFNSVDLRSVNVGDVVVFRSNSLGHRANLVLSHGRPAVVKGFAKNRTGAAQVTVQFKDGEPISLAPSNLIKRTPEAAEAGKAAWDTVQAAYKANSESHGPQVAEAITVRQIQLQLLNEGVFNGLDNREETIENLADSSLAF